MIGSWAQRAIRKYLRSKRTDPDDQIECRVCLCWHTSMCLAYLHMLANGVKRLTGAAHQVPVVINQASRSTLWSEGSEEEIMECSNETDMKMFSKIVYLEEILAMTSFICLITVKSTAEYPWGQCVQVWESIQGLSLRMSTQPCCIS